MNGLDVLLTLAALAAAVGGWSLGFLRRFAGWLGAAVGIAAATFATPVIIRNLGLPSDIAVLGVSGAVFVLLAAAGQALGGLVGSKAHSNVRTELGHRVDAVGGSILGVVGVVVLIWLLIPIMGEASGWPAAAVRSSALASYVSDHFPSAPSQIAEIERELAGGEFPKIFTGLKRAPDIASPPENSPMTTVEMNRTARSVVRVEAPACGRIQSGSGFFVATGIVVTNAHVVAGSDNVSITDTDGSSHRAHVIHFDPRVDLAVLSTSYNGPALTVTDPAVGDGGLVMGFPGGGNLAPSPFIVAQEMNARGYDIYDKLVVTRDLLVLASRLAPGDSGSAVVRKDGSVVGVAVAIAPDDSTVAYAISGETLRTTLAATDPSIADTGPCI